MAKQGPKLGTKLDVTARLAGKDEEMELKSSFAGESGDQWEISTPMAAGKSVTLPAGTEVAMYWVDDKEQCTQRGVVGKLVKKGIRTYLKITTRDEVERRERRAFVRVAAELPVEICGFYTAASGERSELSFPGHTTDISNGGAAIVTNADVAVGEVVKLLIARKGVKKVAVMGRICWRRAAPRGSGYRDSIGVEFLFTNNTEGTEISKLTAALVAKQ